MSGQADETTPLESNFSDNEGADDADPNLNEASSPTIQTRKKSMGKKFLGEVKGFTKIVESAIRLPKPVSNDIEGPNLGQACPEQVSLDHASMNQPPAPTEDVEKYLDCNEKPKGKKKSMGRLFVGEVKSFGSRVSTAIKTSSMMPAISSISLNEFELTEEFKSQLLKDFTTSQNIYLTTMQDKFHLCSPGSYPSFNRALLQILVHKIAVRRRNHTNRQVLWNFLCKISPREIAAGINGDTISTGFLTKCEKWIQHALDNPALFKVAFAMSNLALLKHTYIPGAFMLDPEKTDIMCQLLDGVNQIREVNLRTSSTGDSPVEQMLHVEDDVVEHLKKKKHRHGKKKPTRVRSIGEIPNSGNSIVAPGTNVLDDSVKIESVPDNDNEIMTETLHTVKQLHSELSQENLAHSDFFVDSNSLSAIIQGSKIVEVSEAPQLPNLSSSMSTNVKESVLLKTNLETDIRVEEHQEPKEESCASNAKATNAAHSISVNQGIHKMKVHEPEFVDALDPVQTEEGNKILDQPVEVSEQQPQSPHTELKSNTGHERKSQGIKHKKKRRVRSIGQLGSESNCIDVNLDEEIESIIASSSSSNQVVEGSEAEALAAQDEVDKKTTQSNIEVGLLFHQAELSSTEMIVHSLAENTTENTQMQIEFEGKDTLKSSYGSVPYASLQEEDQEKEKEKEKERVSETHRTDKISINQNVKVESAYPVMQGSSAALESNTQNGDRNDSILLDDVTLQDRANLVANETEEVFRLNSIVESKDARDDGGKVELPSDVKTLREQETPVAVSRFGLHQLKLKLQSAANKGTDFITSSLSAPMHAISESIGLNRPAEEYSASGSDTDDEFDIIEGTDIGEDGVDIVFDENDMLMLLSKISDVPAEIPFENENRCCTSCGTNIPVVDKEDETSLARKCEYDGRWYCFDCHLNDTAVIPSLILHRGDPRPRKVSRKIKHFLELIANEPVFTVNMFEHVERHYVKDDHVDLLRLSVVSVCGVIDQAAFIRCNSETIFSTSSEVGYHIVALNPVDCKTVKKGSFDLSSNKANIEAFVTFLKSIPLGAIVMCATFGYVQLSQHKELLSVFVDTMMLGKPFSGSGAHAILSIKGEKCLLHNHNKNAATAVYTIQDPLADLERSEKTAVATIRKELNGLRPIRFALNKLRVKMLKCERINPTEFRKKLWPREHLWESDDVYTIRDITDVARFCVSGGHEALEIRDLLVKLVYQCQKHIQACKCKFCGRAQ